MKSDQASPPAPLNRRNPAELEIDLFCHGIHIDPSCDLEHDACAVVKARAGLGSGLEMVIQAEKPIWLNVPVYEHFVQQTPYTLIKFKGQYRVVDNRNQEHYAVKLPPAPMWYSKNTSSGVPMTSIGVLQGTYLGIYLGKACAFWYSDPKENCKFCATGLNVQDDATDKPKKTIEEVVEVGKAAKEESGVTFVHFNTGFQRFRGLNLCAPYVKAVKEQVGALVGVQAIPSKNLEKYDWIIDCGADHLSFCYELHNPESFRQLLPGKARHVGQETFFTAMEYTSRKMGKGRVSGEIIAGIEPLEDTLAAIDYITSIGAFPTVCIFRPVKGTEMENWASPRYEDMVIVFRHVYEKCMEHGIPIGLAPNIEVSLVVQPTDAQYLVSQSLQKRWYQTKLAAYKTLAQPIFKRELRPHLIKADARLDIKEPNMN